MARPPASSRPWPWRITLLVVLLAVLGGGCDAQRRDGPWVQPRAASNGAIIDPGASHFDVCPGQVSASSSGALALLCIATLAGMLAWSVLRMRAFHRQAASEESVDPDGPLRAGPFVLVGTVEVEDGATPVTIRIEQVGKEWKHKSSWSHSWRETRRWMDVRPFVVRRDDGTTVKVEPGPRVVLHDTLSRFEHSSTITKTRTRIAEVKPGDRIYVAGELVDIRVHGGGGVYREAPRMPRLIPASTGPMVVSTEAPGGTARRLGRVHRLSSFAVGVVLAFQLVIVLFPYLAQHLTGVTSVGELRAVRTYETYHKPKNGSGYWTTHQEAEVSWARDQSGTFRIARDLYTCAVRAGCDRVVVRSASLAGFTLHQLGSRPTLSVTRTLILVIGSPTALIIWLITLVGARPWWLRRKVVDGGSGRLSQTTSSVKDAVPPTETG
ncbi:MAG: hypothetical protein IT370_05970 [Deltaproteobacteria bacterium]|nr:hypothetical protein [Deltaproteobacteria bacterium]